MSPRSQLLIFLALLSSAQVHLYAQGRTSVFSSLPVEIHGQVRFAQGGMPADHVLVRLESFDGGPSIQEIVTDRTGKFRFSGLSRAQYEVVAKAPGFKEAQQHVDLQTSNSNYIIFQLTPDGASTRGSGVRSKVLNANVPAEAQSEFEKSEIALQQNRLNCISKLTLMDLTKPGCDLWILPIFLDLPRSV